MTMLAAPTVYTPAEVERLSHESGRSYELFHGELVEKHGDSTRMSTEATAAAAEIVYLLRVAYPKGRAFVFVESPTYCFADPSHMRKPDVSLVRAERLPEGLGRRDLMIAPDLVVEVVSPSNKFDDQLDRVAEYLEAGVPLVLVVQPARRWVHLFRGDGSVKLLRSSDVLRDEAALPGFTMQIADIFPAPTPTTT